MGGAVKSAGQYEYWFNVKSFEDETVHRIWDEVEIYDEQYRENILLHVSDETGKFELANAKLEKLEIWKSVHVYGVSSNEGQDCIFL